jgi:hypothetical protein
MYAIRPGINYEKLCWAKNNVNRFDMAFVLAGQLPVCKKKQVRKMTKGSQPELVPKVHGFSGFVSV